MVESVLVELSSATLIILDWIMPRGSTLLIMVCCALPVHSLCVNTVCWYIIWLECTPIFVYELQEKYCCVTKCLLCRGLELHQSLSFHSWWGVDAKGICLGRSVPVPTYLFIFCVVRSWGVFPFHKYWGVRYLFSYRIRYHRTCLLIWGHLMWM